MLQDSHPRSLRGVSGDDPEGGAGSGVLRRAARNRSPREAGPRPPGTTTWVRGARCTDPEAMPETEARPREPKTATVERREASVPRHKRVHARLDALWDARRLASAWRIASEARSRASLTHMIRLTGVPPSTRTSLGAPPTLDSGWRSKVANPGRRHAPRERDGLFDIVRRSASVVAVIVPSPLAGEGGSMMPRAMMGEGMDCENPSPIRVRRPTIVPSPTRGEGTTGDSGAASREGPTCGCGKRSPASFPCFRPVIYREWRNQNA